MSSSARGAGPGLRVVGAPDPTLDFRGAPQLLDAPVVAVGQVPFTITGLDAAVEWILQPATADSARSIRLANAYCVALADKDPAYRDLLRSTGVNLPDGTPVVWVMRTLAARRGLPAPGHVRGPSFFERTLDRSQGTDVRHFFLGGSETTLTAMLAEIRSRFPGTQVAGSFSPPFGDLTPLNLAAWAERIAASGTDVVWVGLGTPKQDIAAVELCRHLGMHCVGVGAAFDFLAGTQAEAPAWIQRWALEWLFRLVREPRRLWKRYVFGNLRFTKVAVLDAVRALGEPGTP